MKERERERERETEGGRGESLLGSFKQFLRLASSKQKRVQHTCCIYTDTVPPLPLLPHVPCDLRLIIMCQVQILFNNVHSAKLPQI